jgi:hypothetical protein
VHTLLVDAVVMRGNVAMGGESACRGGGNVDRESDDGAFLIDLCLFVCRRVCRQTWPIHRALRTRSAPFPPEHTRTHTHTHTHAESTTCSEPSTLTRRSPPRAHALAAAMQHGMCGRSHRKRAEGVGALYVVCCMMSRATCARALPGRPRAGSLAGAGGLLHVVSV